MQDKYVGDIGDFGKYGLLRYLCGVTGPKMDVPLSLGVVWYRNNSRGADGNRIDYLNVSDSNDFIYRKCDQELYDKLQQLVGSSLVSRNKRNVGQISSSLILPANTQYYDVHLSVRERNDWHNNALKKTDQASLVFVDPDNGLASESIKHTRKESLKYVFMDEIKDFMKRPQSLIIYHHLGQRNATAEDTIKNISIRLENEIKCPIVALRWHRIQGRVYFIVVHPDHMNKLCDKIGAFLGTKWGKIRQGLKQPHFCMAYPPKEI